ncbi:MAG TPA: DUF167 domain-containing protein [Dehalococcoidia bacterium]|nr:DUF167 domain-containing protein [Dehalococcoidia bacterium]
MAESTVLVVRVTPRAGRDEIAGWHGEELRVRLRAPPVDGRANEALLRLIASRLGVPPSSIELVRGATARVKRLRIEGLSEAELRRRLS